MNATNTAAVADLLHQQPVSSGGPPSIPISAELRAAVVEQLLRRSDSGLLPAAVTDEVTLRDGLGLASIDSLELAMDLEEYFGVVLADDELFQLRTVGDLMTTIVAKQSSRISTR